MVRNFIKKEIAGLEVIELPGDPEGGMIILFHGFGANALDLVSLSTAFKHSPEPTWLFPSGPLEITFYQGYTGRAWFPIDRGLLNKMDLNRVEEAFPVDLSDVRTRIERLITELNFPRSKILLGGFSQGAVIAVDTLLHGKDRWGGLLIFSGTLICGKTWLELSHFHAQTPFFQSHGTHDSLLPIEKAKELALLLKNGGLEGSFHPFNGGHEIPQHILVQFHSFLTKTLNNL